ncbi:MAG: multiheme c-type cytochrome [Sphingomonadales bacterium]
MLVAAVVAALIAYDQPKDEAATLPADYWHQPLAPQGDAPEHWSELEKSLTPESCGTCHTDKYEEWRTTLHAKAMSPGLVGQLLTMNEAGAASCMNCHAPLAEQKQAFEEARARGDAHTASGQKLAAAGNSCAACHVRGNRRHGPPQLETGETGQSDPDNPHGGVFRTADFEGPEFCGSCHQFPQEWAINGKPMQNTVAEWRTSPQAMEGIGCQSCHMPDRKHLWRGIHDRDMVESGLTATFDATKDQARFTLTNSGVGHAFPTYVTPKVVMHAVALDADGEPVPGAEASHLIQRVVSFVGGQWVESLDSRLMPGQSAALKLAWGDSDKVKMWLAVHPDDFYDHKVYDQLIQQGRPESSATRLIVEADKLAQESRFRLFETVLQRPE